MNLTRAVRTMTNRQDVESEIDAELRTHIELETEELIRAGWSPVNARRKAMLAFGGAQQVREAVVEDQVPQWLESLRRDSRIAMRSLARYRTFSITAILALSLAIAVNTTLFSVIDAMINPSEGAREPERLYQMQYFGDPRKKVDFRAAERATTAAIGMYEGFTAISGGGVRSVERRIRADGAQVMKVRPNFFTMLGAEPLLGRLTPSDDPASRSSSAVITPRIQALLFSEGESPIGKSILFDGSPYTVIGVTAGFNALDDLGGNIWYFSRPDEALNTKLVRLKDGETVEKLQQRLDVLAAQLALTAGNDTRDTRFMLKPLKRQFHAANFHYALLGSGIAILLVACTNLANLQIARGLTRATELAVRSALGASRRQLVSQLLIESGVLAGIALVVALLFALAGNALIRAYVPPYVGEYVVQPHSSWRMVPGAMAAAILCVIAIGLFPALHVSRVNINELIKGRAGTGAHRANRRVYGLLVIAQIGFTLPLTCAAVLSSIAAWRAADTDFLIRNEIGFDPRPLVNVSVTLPRDSLNPMISFAEKSAELIARARAVPGVQYAAVEESGPLSGDAVTVDDDGGAMREVQAPLDHYRIVTPDYFKTYGFPIVAGRDFKQGEGEPSPVVIDSTAQELLWRRSNAIGRAIKLGRASSTVPTHTVAGMMDITLSDDARELMRTMRRTRIGGIYRLVNSRDSVKLYRYNPSMTVLARVTGDRNAVAERLRRAFHEGSHAAPIVILMEDYLGLARRRIVTRFIASLFVTFGLVGLGLSALGLYAIVAQSVADRRREVAVRIALGASERKIIHSLLREGNVLVLAGIAVGLALTTVTVSWLGMFLNHAPTSSAIFFGAMCIALFIAMVLSALGPAVKATRLDPMEVLRAE